MLERSPIRSPPGTRRAGPAFVSLIGRLSHRPARNMALGRRVTCEEFVRELPDFIDRELSTTRLAELRHHLEECERCLRKHRFESAVLERIRVRMTNIALPPELEARVLASIGAAGSMS